jgi:hypothetical protein
MIPYHIIDHLEIKIIGLHPVGESMGKSILVHIHTPTSSFPILNPSP